MKTKKLIFSLGLVIFIQPNLAAQWTNIYTYNNVTLTGVECINEDTVFVAGYNSTILRTFDKGESWQLIDPGFEIFSTDINFPDQNTGYIIGSSGRIAKTTDYGDNWELIITDTNYTLIEALFINADSGWVIGFHMSELTGIVLKTINGGIYWDYFYTEYELFDIEMLNNLKGFIGIKSDFYNPHGFLITENGGDTWNLSNPEFWWVNAVSFINENIGYCTASQEGLHKTINGGSSWEFINDSYEIGFFTRSQILFLTEETGFYCGWEWLFDDGKISRTDDGGNSWTDQITDRFYDMDMINADTGYSLTLDGKIYKTTNGGIPVGISELNITKARYIVVFPNPLTKKSTLKINPDVLAKHCQLDFILYDQKGIKIKHIKNIKTTETEISLGNLSSGLYFYTITRENKIFESGKLLIK